MRIALFGYGKMGKMIAQLAPGKGHVIAATHTSTTPLPDPLQVDVGIDISVPSAALKNISFCLERGIPVISGTTGWLQDYDKAVALCHGKNGAFLHASNFSVGVHVFFRLNAYLAAIMKHLPDYSVRIEEIHHQKKLDAPSGTAITLAENIIKHSNKTHWKLGENIGENGISITSKRTGAVPGTHTVQYNGPTDSLMLQHVAHNREGFALGALMAAEWLVGREGVYTMTDVLESLFSNGE